MKAVRLLEYGGQMKFTKVPTPTIAPDEILVKIESTAVNHLDHVKAFNGVGWTSRKRPATGELFFLDSLHRTYEQLATSASQIRSRDNFRVADGPVFGAKPKFKSSA